MPRISQIKTKVDLFDKTKIAHEFNFFFTNAGKSLENKIPNAFLPHSNTL